MSQYSPGPSGNPRAPQDPYQHNGPRPDHQRPAYGGGQPEYQRPYDAPYPDHQAPYGGYPNQPEQPMPPAPAPQPRYSEYSDYSERRRPRRDGVAQDRWALVIQTIGYIASGLIALWIALYFLGANQGNGFVGFVHSVADGLSVWSQDIFTLNSEGLSLFLNDALAAVIYLAVGHGIGAWIRRL